MPGVTRVEPLNTDIDLIIRQDLSPEARSAVLAEFAQESIADAEAANEEALGHPTPYHVFVDGQENAPLRDVRPDGVIVANFDLFEDLLTEIGQLLVENSPIGSGRDPHPGLYAASHKLFIDGVEVEAGAPLPQSFETAVFLNTQPYARKIERGLSAQAPDGVYQSVAQIASRRFGNVAKISFTYQEEAGSGERQPAILITLR